MADSGQTGKGMIEEHSAGLGDMRAGRVDPGGDGEAEVVDEHGSLGAGGAAGLAAGLVKPGPPSSALDGLTVEHDHRRLGVPAGLRPGRLA